MTSALTEALQQVMLDRTPEESARPVPVPVCEERLRMCLTSASWWAEALPRYADRQQAKADRFAIAAGVIAAVTGASVFPVVNNTTGYGWQLALALPALLAAVLAVFPTVKQYGEMAGRARELSSLYGPLKGELTDAVAAYRPENADDARWRELIARFQEAKAKKDQLRYLPSRPS